MDQEGPEILLAIGVPVALLLVGSAVLFVRGRTVSSLLQLLGAGGMMVVVLAHVAEAFHLLPMMNWGLEHSPGHYLDLASAVAGATLFPAGYLLQALASRRAIPRPIVTR